MRTILQNGTFRNGILGKAFVPIEFDALLQRAHHILTVGYTGETINVVATSAGEWFLFNIPFTRISQPGYLQIKPQWFTIEPYLIEEKLAYTIADIENQPPLPIDDHVFAEPMTPMHVLLDRTGIHPSKRTDQIFALIKGEGGYFEEAIRPGIHYRIAAAGALDDDTDEDKFVVLTTKDHCMLIGIPEGLIETLWDDLVATPEEYDFEIVKSHGFLFPKITSRE